MKKIVTGDTVVVISGRNKGAQGKVTKLLPAVDRVLIEGVNIVKKHVKPGRGPQAGIIEMEAPLHISNVMLVEPATGEPTRVGIRKNTDGKNERYSKKTNDTISAPARD